jgi:conjugal transfer mating pair stabilization protein TraG
MNAHSGDAVADIILDFIAIGESGGNYNAVIGNAKSAADLSSWTLGGIRLQLMPALLQKGEPSTAVGRYQIIRKTFESLQATIQLDDGVRFTPVIQDQMGRQLLNVRGYSKWISGAIDNLTFAHNLSCEWASLPDPYNDGKSHYDGVGPNHAGTTLDKVYAVLTHAKETK